MKWILIVPLIILAVFAGLLILLLLTPVSVRVKFINGALTCRIKVYGIGYTVYPMKKRKPKKQKAIKKATKPKKTDKQEVLPITKEIEDIRENKPASEQSIKNENKQKIDVEQILDYVKFGITSAKRILKGVKVNNITVCCIIGTDNAATTAIAFGSASAALSALLPIAEDTFNIKNKDISLDADFAGTVSSLDVNIKISTIMFKMAIATLIIFLKFKKMMKKAV